MTKEKEKSATVTEFVIRCGKDGVFSSPSRAAADAKMNALHTADAAQGVEKVYTLSERKIAYEGVDVAPTGEDSRGVPAKVTEKVLS